MYFNWEYNVSRTNKSNQPFDEILFVIKEYPRVTIFLTNVYIYKATPTNLRSKWNPHEINVVKVKV